MFKNEGSCNDGNVALSKRYKASDMESGKDASVLESRTVRARSNKCQPHERERINSSSSSLNKRFITKNLKNTQSERQKINGVNKELSEGDKRLNKAKDFGSRRWQYSSIVRRKLDSTADSYSDTEEFVFKMGSSSFNEVSTSGRANESNNEGEGGLEQFSSFPGPLVSYPPSSDAFREFCKAKAAVGRKWGKCVEFAGIKSTVEKKESLLDEVTEEEAELELVLGELGLSRKKRVDSRLNKIKKAPPASGATGSGDVAKGKRKRVEPLAGSRKKVPEGQSTSVDDLKEVEERARLTILQGKEDTSQMVARLAKRIWLGIEEQESELKKAKSGLEKYLARANTEALKEVRELKAAHAVVIGQFKVKEKANLYEMAEERDRLGCHLMLKSYSQEEVDVIKADTYAEEEEEETKVLGVVDGLDGVFPQTVLDNQGDDVELPEGRSEKVVREMSLRINDHESRLARERETSKTLLSVQAELQVELDASRTPEDHVLMCNQEFAEQFDRMKEANENRDDQYVKAHFRLEKLN
ncbi:hypothetical protein GIB67_042597 [Kingdonia uniflora]|uniref:Uncharacterized protein n=1 Tax=Kingdonia uniflora TaxID=39325 RepID=A0A7J7M1I6_9MAGN|nr:hypothetical protein GIB67_042597 [Kingdonia uniflora]